jgi:hypothetical protein
MVNAFEDNINDDLKYPPVQRKWLPALLTSGGFIQEPRKLCGQSNGIATIVR